MALEIHLEPATIAALDTAVASGRFRSYDEAISGALQLVSDIDAETGPLTPAETAGIERGLADLRAGRTLPFETVMTEMTRRFAQ